MVSDLVAATLRACGADVTDLGLSTTPTVELAVTELQADGGIIITASHNTEEWNALKLLNGKGEFLSDADGKKILDSAEKLEFDFASVENIGTYTKDETQVLKHISRILALPFVDVPAIRKAHFRIAVDGINSTGGVIVPQLLESLGVEDIVELNAEPSGKFAHNPEPIPANLGEICKLVKEKKADLGFVVDPDVDRLAIVMENGELFNEEYTLVAVADYILQEQPGNTVSNLSSTRALRDVTEKAGGRYFASAVGEVNVVDLMKQEEAVIGGEGNGGVIYPALHYGRDALVGIALFLSHLARSGNTCSDLRKTYPDYYISKNKVELSPEMKIECILESVRNKYPDNPYTIVDGLKIEFGKEWVHLRESNTEAIIRIYAESNSQDAADALARKIMEDILNTDC